HRLIPIIPINGHKRRLAITIAQRGTVSINEIFCAKFNAIGKPYTVERRRKPNFGLVLTIERMVALGSVQILSQGFSTLSLDIFTPLFASDLIFIIIVIFNYNINKIIKLNLIKKSEIIL